MDPKEISGLISRIKSLCDEINASIESGGQPKKIKKDEYMAKSEDERMKFDKEQVGLNKEEEPEEEENA